MELKLSQLKWRSRRSMLELDLIFDKFINSEAFIKLTDEERKEYSNLLECDDAYILNLMRKKNNASTLRKILINKILFI